MTRSARPCRQAATVLLLGSLVLLLGAPVCESAGCPMGAAARATCRAMGLDCCQGKGGTVSHASLQAPPIAATLATGGMVTPPSRDRASADAGASLPEAPPAVLQGVGLFTLLAVFRI